MRVLVTGGAGYIGSHAIAALARSGHTPVAFDNLFRGHAEAIGSTPLVQGDLGDTEALARTLKDHAIEAVLHFAGLTYVGESVGHPELYYRTNVTGTLSLLDALWEAKVDKLIFSSTAAVYGSPERVPIDEDHRCLPVNPYGRTKLAIEWALGDFAASRHLRYTALRYFNAAGASSDGSIGEDHEPETHLIPRVLMAVAGEVPHVTVLGTDYDTPDGTCVRDYIHVEDLADAHVLAVERLTRSGQPPRALNLGTGKGHSVREVIACAEKVTGRRVPVVEGARRAGDPPILVASAERARKALGWSPRLADLESMVRTAWNWLQGGRRYATRRGR